MYVRTLPSFLHQTLTLPSAATSGASKEANKEVAKDNNAGIGTR